MKASSRLVLGPMLAAVFSAASAADPTVTNVRAEQTPGSKQVEILYDLSGNMSPVHVSLQVSSNGGTTFAVPVTAVSGDVGVNIPLGRNKRMTWKAGIDWNNQLSSAMRFRVTASDILPAPDGFVLIPAGNFTMGRTSGDTDSNAPPVTVNVSAFYMAKYETTKELWDEVRNWGTSNGYTDLRAGNGSHASKGANHPVHTISWFDIVKWCNARSQKDGLTPVYTVSGAVMKTGTSEPLPNWSANGYRLPTEAEWEKAARGGVSGQRFPWGDTISQSQANYMVYSSNGTTNYFSYDATSRPPATGIEFWQPYYFAGETPYSSPVASFAPNGYGLYDIAGNMREWCWDWIGNSTYVDGATDPHGAISGSARVRRGGSWSGSAIYCRAADRNGGIPTGTASSFGFRLARSLVP